MKTVHYVIAILLAATFSFAAAPTETFLQYVQSKPQSDKGKINKLKVLGVQDGIVVQHAYTSGMVNVIKNHIESSPGSNEQLRSNLKLIGIENGKFVQHAYSSVKISYVSIDASESRFGGIYGDGDSFKAFFNTNSIQNALDYAKALPAKGVKVVFIPSGVYKVNDTITVPYGVMLQGAGPYYDGTTIESVDATKDVIHLATDGYYVSYNGVKDMTIKGGKRGIYAFETAYLTLSNLQIRDCTIGYHLKAVHSSIYTRVNSRNNHVGAWLDYSNNRFVDQSTWDTCQHNNNSVAGMIFSKGTGNVFDSTQFVYNHGKGLIAGPFLYDFDTDSIVADSNENLQLANFLNMIGNESDGANTFQSCYFEEATTPPAGTLIEIVNRWDMVFINPTIYSYNDNPTGRIVLKRAGRTKFIAGRLIDWNAQTRGTTSDFAIDRTSFETLIDIQGYSKGVTLDNGINTEVSGIYSIEPKKKVTAIMQNRAFNVAGSGGDDVVANWTETTGSSGKVSQDSTDIFYNHDVSINSVKIDQGATASYFELTQQSNAALIAGKTYYIHITYKTDTGKVKKNAPIGLNIQDAGNGYVAYNWINGVWQNTSGANTLSLPLSDQPYTVAIPFTAPSTGSKIYMRIIFDAFSGNANNAKYHLYSAFISPSKKPIIEGEWSAIPTVGTWEKGIFIANALHDGTKSGWECVKSGTFESATTTGNVSSGSPVVTSVANISLFKEGQYLNVPNISTSSKILKVDAVSNSITLESNATSSVNGVTIAFSSPSWVQVPSLGSNKRAYIPSDANYTFGGDAESVLIVTGITATRTVTIPAPTTTNQLAQVVNQSNYSVNLVVQGVNIYYLRNNFHINIANSATITLPPGASKSFRSTDQLDWVEFGPEYNKAVYLWSNNGSYTVQGWESKIVANNTINTDLYFQNASAAQMGTTVTVSNLSSSKTVTMTFGTSNVYTKTGTSLTYNAQPQSIALGPLSERTFYADGNGNYIEM